ncbi:MBL fold metallo-hydrolase [Litorisediminicola beolgyonensis]|uniref:MBL fold metallo-hydrolase n=1 Tax=Litorisediminicola beolgyonensis TaxID=1173614 RepID=A0ABW3ZK06_9RHOB
MSQTRRTFLVSAAAAAGGTMILPYAALAEAHAGNMFSTDAGDITVHPLDHASFVMETPKGTIYVDPVGDPARYAEFPPADLILITHEHGDHYNAETLTALMGENTSLITNPAVHDMLPADLASGAMTLANGESHDWDGLGIDAIAAHNTTEDRMNFHPEGRDNGYVLSFEGFRVYISGDTEPTEDMLALENIDVAFLCMNLPFTQTAEQAAEAVKTFKPAYVYPYHYRGRDGGTQDPEEFASLVGDAAEVKLVDWYPNEEV